MDTNRSGLDRIGQDAGAQAGPNVPPGPGYPNEEVEAPDWEKDVPAQAIHLSGKNRRNLISIFIWHDDTFQVVDERGGARATIIDTHTAPKAKVQQVTL